MEFETEFGRIEVDVDKNSAYFQSQDYGANIRSHHDSTFNLQGEKVGLDGYYFEDMWGRQFKFETHTTKKFINEQLVETIDNYLYHLTWKRLG